MTTQTKKTIVENVVVKNRAQAALLSEEFFVCTKDLTVYKKIVVCPKTDQYGELYYQREGIAKLIIPKGTLCFRASRTDSRKCRAAKAKVVSITCLDKRTKVNSGASSYDNEFEYRVGSTLTPKWGFATHVEPCTDGIHFFLTQQEARNYEL
jgi:hypothetical protein